MVLEMGFEPTAYWLRVSCSTVGATVGTLSADKLKEIAEYKMPDLNAYDLDAAMKIVAGTAKNMGVKVEGIDA